VLQFLRLAPIIVGEHYRVFVTIQNLTYRTLSDVRLQFQINVKLSTSEVPTSKPAIAEIGDISARDVRTVRAYNYLLTREPCTEDFKIVDAYARLQGVSEVLPFEYQGSSSPSYLDVYTVEPRGAIYDRILDVILFIFTAISAIGVFKRW
jgi:hypothetical protein